MVNTFIWQHSIVICQDFPSASLMGHSEKLYRFIICQEMLFKTVLKDLALASSRRDQKMPDFSLGAAFSPGPIFLLCLQSGC